jgi:hypothetical protein
MRRMTDLSRTPLDRTWPGASLPHFRVSIKVDAIQVELWLSKIERDLIARGIFTSTDDLSRKLLRYIREYNKTARPIKWKYTDVSRRIRAPHSTVTVH